VGGVGAKSGEDYRVSEVELAMKFADLAFLGALSNGNEPKLDPSIQQVPCRPQKVVVSLLGAEIRHCSNHDLVCADSELSANRFAKASAFACRCHVDPMVQHLSALAQGSRHRRHDLICHRKGRVVPSACDAAEDSRRQSMGCPLVVLGADERRSRTVPQDACR
jgi:hypothetical protein